MIEAVLFGLLLLTGKWVTACLLLGVCAWDLRTYLRGEHKVRRQHAQGVRRGLQPPGLASFLSWVWARQCACGGVCQRREPADAVCIDAARAARLASSVWSSTQYPCPPRHAS